VGSTVRLTASSRATTGWGRQCARRRPPAPPPNLDDFGLSVARKSSRFGGDSRRSGCKGHKSTVNVAGIPSNGLRPGSWIDHPLRGTSEPRRAGVSGSRVCRTAATARPEHDEVERSNVERRAQIIKVRIQRTMWAGRHAAWAGVATRASVRRDGRAARAGGRRARACRAGVPRGRAARACRAGVPRGRAARG
jgi:hypothetical protein